MIKTKCCRFGAIKAQGRKEICKKEKMNASGLSLGCHGVSSPFFFIVNIFFSSSQLRVSLGFFLKNRGLGFFALTTFNTHFSAE